MIIYVAGHYRARTIFGKILNIIKAYIVSIRITRRGYIVFCPHMNTALFDIFCHHEDKFWLEAGLEFLSKFDALYLMEDWYNSSGSVGELIKAESLEMPIYYSLDEIKDLR